MDYFNWECNSKNKHLWEMFIDKDKNCEAGIRSTCDLVPNKLTESVIGFLEHLSDLDESSEKYEHYNSIFQFYTKGIYYIL
jgi:hypothetical protein